MADQADALVVAVHDLHAAYLDATARASLAERERNVLRDLLAHREELAVRNAAEFDKAQKALTAAEARAEGAEAEMQGVRDELTRMAGENDDLRGTVALHTATIARVRAVYADASRLAGDGDWHRLVEALRTALDGDGDA